MANTPDIRESILTADAAKWLLAGVIAAALAGASFLVWLDSRITNNVNNSVRGYSNEYLMPRIVKNERDISEINKRLDKLSDKIDQSDSSRNRQYGELKSNQEKTLKVLESVTVMGVRSK